MDNEFSIGAPPKLDEQEQDTRYIESRQVESGVLTNLEDLYTALINDKSGKGGESTRYYESSLESDLQRRFNDWQFFYDDKPGFNSGGAGETFTRLLASGIMQDMPQIEALPYNTAGYGVKVVKRPTNSTDVGRIEVVTSVGRSSPYSGCRFVFETSLKAIKQRTKAVYKEIDVKRGEISKNRDSKDRI